MQNEISNDKGGPGTSRQFEYIGDIPVCGKFVDQNGDPFIAVPTFNGGIELVPARGSKIREYVRLCSYKLNEEIISEQKLEKLVGQISSLCFLEGQRVHLYNRVGIADDCIFVDGINEIYKISPSGWGIQADPLVLFRRYHGMKELPSPKKGGNIRRMLEFTNIEDSLDQLLFLTFLVFAFVPNVPHPILVL